MFCRNVSSMFFAFKFLIQSDVFAKPIAFAWWPFLPIFRMVSFFDDNDMLILFMDRGFFPRKKNLVLSNESIKIELPP